MAAALTHTHLQLQYIEYMYVVCYTVQTSPPSAQLQFVSLTEDAIDQTHCNKCYLTAVWSDGRRISAAAEPDDIEGLETEGGMCLQVLFVCICVWRHLHRDEFVTALSLISSAV